MPEIDIANIAKGQSVNVSFAAYPDKSFKVLVAFTVVGYPTRAAPEDAFFQTWSKFKPNMLRRLVLQYETCGLKSSALLIMTAQLLVETGALDFHKATVLPERRRPRSGVESWRPHHCQGWGAAQ